MMTVFRRIPELVSIRNIEDKRVESFRIAIGRVLVINASITAIILLWNQGLRCPVPAFLSFPVSIIDYFSFVVLLCAVALRLYTAHTAIRTRSGVLSFLLWILALVRLLTAHDTRPLILAGQLTLIWTSRYMTDVRERFVEQLISRAAHLVPVSFLAAIFIGSLLLFLPAASMPDSSTSYIDALFTSTSATCVTGLIVTSTPHHFSSFGQWTILILIQIGGLGMMTLSLAVLAFFNRAATGRQREALLEILPGVGRPEIYRMVRFLFTVTFVIEGIGFCILMLLGLPPSPSGASPAFNSLFHSVSAFCNAGFSLYDDSLSHASGGVIFTVAILIILGGLGFIVLRECIHKRTLSLMTRRMKAMTWWSSLSLHTKMVLISTIILIFAGWLIVFYGEYDNLLRDYSFNMKSLHSFFHSVTLRTAGFNTLPVALFSPALLFGMCILMFIGASPGSTGGGIKTSTTAVLLLSLKSLISGRGTLEFHGRSIDERLFQRAVAIGLMSIATLAVGIFFLLISETHSALDLIFEATSAFGTVGLSTGITPHLTFSGKVIIIILMFFGRVGPLTIALSMGRKRVATGRYRYPTGNVLVG